MRFTCILLTFWVLNDAPYRLLADCNASCLALSLPVVLMMRFEALIGRNGERSRAKALLKIVVLFEAEASRSIRKSKDGCFHQAEISQGFSLGLLGLLMRMATHSQYRHIGGWIGNGKSRFPSGMTARKAKAEAKTKAGPSLAQDDNIC
jgi:hypothetical protein